MKQYFENKVAVVTGGASGIGLCLCEQMLALGASAVVVATTLVKEARSNKSSGETARAFSSKRWRPALLTQTRPSAAATPSTAAGQARSATASATSCGKGGGQGVNTVMIPF